MLRAIKNLIFNFILELAQPGLRVEKDVSINLRSVLKKQIVFGKKNRLVRCAVLSGKIKLGDYTYVNSYSELAGGDRFGITIGNYCSISRNVFITATNDHDINAATTYPGPVDLGAPVTIGNDVWIGANAVILPGVTIGDGAVVGAGAVVPEGTSIPPYEIWGGVPAKKISTRLITNNFPPKADQPLAENNI